MKYNLHTHHLDLTDLDYEQLEKKLDRLTKFLKTPYTTDVTFKRSTHHNKGQVINCKINISQGKKVVHADRQEGSVQDALDETIDALRHSLAKMHDKEKKKRFSIRNFLSRTS